MLTFTVEGQEIKRTDNERVYAGSNDYLACAFEFSQDWNGLDITAHFQNGNAVKSIFGIVSETSFNVPWEVLHPGNINIFIEGYSDGVRISTAEMSKPIHVWRNGRFFIPNLEKTKSWFEQVLDAFHSAQTKVDEMYTKAQNGEFDGKLEYSWDGSRLGVRRVGEEEYDYSDLRGASGVYVGSGDPPEGVNVQIDPSDMADDIMTREDIAEEFLDKETAESLYLKKTSAVTDYLSITAARTSYLRKDDASQNYLTKTTASSTYLSKAEASSKYATSLSLSTYLLKATAANNYLQKSSAEVMYLKKVDAADTYLTKDDANEIYVPREALTCYVELEHYPTPDGSPGVIRVKPDYGIGLGKYNDISVDTGDTLVLQKATEAEINQKTNNYKVIVPSNLDYAVRSGLCNSSTQWSTQDKENALRTLGIKDLIDGLRSLLNAEE